jgi:hypothetical protein
MCAGRSDFIQATLPRFIKRILAMSPLAADPHQMAIMRKIFIDAHAHQRNFRTKQHHDEIDKLPTEIGKQLLDLDIEDGVIETSRVEKIIESRERQDT